MFLGKKSESFFALENDFQHIERRFIINAIKRHMNKDLDESDLNATNLFWLLDFLKSIQESFGQMGWTMNHIIISKIKIKFQ